MKEISELICNLMNLKNMMRVENTAEENSKIYEETKRNWIRLQRLAKHPFKFLYTGEQIFWKIIRLTFGSRAGKTV